jgi:ketosteroid isomerase-like protein
MVREKSGDSMVSQPRGRGRDFRGRIDLGEKKGKIEPMTGNAENPDILVPPRKVHLHIFKWLLYGFLAFSTEGIAQQEEIQTAIVDRLQKWPQDFNAKDIPAVCDLFASDLIATYPGAPDRNYDGMCTVLSNAINSKDKNYHYELSKIEQMIVNCDLAVVRLIWILTVTDLDQTVTERIEERGLDVFRKQKDGQWRISISYAYPVNEMGSKT